MPAQTKRRRLSLYSLPVVVAIGFLLVAKLAAWQQSDIVADLADCIAHGEAREASDAVLKLAAMPNPPISTLVTAAAADERQTADAGQVAISKLLRRWQRDIERKHGVATVASQLCELAESLDKQQHDFANADHQWLAITSGKILRLANSLPASKTPLVAIHCDAILAAVDAGGSIAVSGVEEGSTGSSIGTVEKSQKPAEGETSASQPQRIGNSAAPNRGTNEQPTASNEAHESASSNATDSTFNLEDDTASAIRDNEPPAGTGGGNDVPASDEFSAHTLAPPNQFHDSDWARPILRILPAKPDGVPVDRVPVDEVAKEVVPESRSAAQGLRVAVNDPWKDVETKELLRRWRGAEGDDVLTIERELGRRGFGKVTTRMVRQFFSEEAEERMRLVDDVLAQPGGSAGAWLLLLAEDPDAEVRLFAVTLMATSNNASLVDKAWQVSIRDRDPRIADLAGRLRERRAGTLRR